MAGAEEFWVPLVDEPLGSIVAQIQEENPEIGRLVNSPHRLLAFRTFAYIRVGILLGQLLVELDTDPTDGAERTWVEAILADPAQHAKVAQCVLEVAEEIAADPKYADEEELGPDDAARQRFREFAKKQLGST